MSARQLNRLARAKGKGIDPLLSGAYGEEHVEESEDESEEKPKRSLMSAAAVSDSDIRQSVLVHRWHGAKYPSVACFSRTIRLFTGMSLLSLFLHLPCVFGVGAVCRVFRVDIESIYVCSYCSEITFSPLFSSID